MAKRALCVGIDRFSAEIPALRGAAADARALAELLRGRGYQATALLDGQARRAAILDGLGGLLAESQPGDEVVLSFHGYGGHYPDAQGDPRRGMDELFIAHDHRWGSGTMLRDEDLATALGAAPRGVSVVAIFDCSPDGAYATAGGGGSRTLGPPEGDPQYAAARDQGWRVRGVLRQLDPRWPRVCVFAGQPGQTVQETAVQETAVQETAVQETAVQETAVQEAPAPGATGEGVAGAFTHHLLAALRQGGDAHGWPTLVAHVTQSLQGAGFSQQPMVVGLGPALTAPALGGAVADPAPSKAATPSAGWGGAAAVGAAAVGAAAVGAAAVGAASVGAAAAGAAPVGSHPAAGGQAPASTPGPGAAGWGAGPSAAGSGWGGGAPLAAPAAPPNPVDLSLRGFGPSAATVRVTDAVLRVLPMAPPKLDYTDLAGAAALLVPQSTDPRTVQRMAQLAASEDVTRALWVAGAIDKADMGISAYSGMQAVLGMFLNDSTSSAFETDSQQAVDALLKLLGMAYMVHRLFPGGVTDKLGAYYQTSAGKALTMYYASIDVALPFADNTLMAGGNLLQSLWGRHGTQAVSKMATFSDARTAQEAQTMAGRLLEPVQGVVNQVRPYASAVANTAASYLPGVMNVTDKVAGVVATGADALPTYTYLGSRLAAEAVALRVLRGG